MSVSQYMMAISVKIMSSLIVSHPTQFLKDTSQNENNASCD